MNEMGYLYAGDVISGQQATGMITVHNADGSTTVEDIFWARNIIATMTINKTPLRVVNYRGEQHKPNGWTGEGSMNIYYVTSIFRRMAVQYAKSGVLPYFDMVVTNFDPSSSVGAQTTMLKRCLIDDVLLVKLDIETDTLDEDVGFSFDDFEILEEFVAPTLGSN